MEHSNNNTAPRYIHGIVGVFIILGIMSLFIAQKGETATAPIISDSLILTITGTQAYIHGANFGNSPLSPGFFVSFNNDGSIINILPEDNDVVSWEDSKVVVRTPDIIDNTTLVSITTPDGESNKVPLLVYQYQSFPLPVGNDGLPIHIEGDISGKIWASAEFSKSLFSLEESVSSSSVFANVIPESTNDIFRYPDDLGGGETNVSALAEDIDIDSQGNIWTTQGGGIFYSGEGINASRVIKYNPTSGAFACYNIPTNNAELYHVYFDEVEGKMWASLGGTNANTIISFKPETFTEPGDTDCLFDFQTSAPVQYCVDQNEDRCFKRHDMIAQQAIPSDIVEASDGGIWSAQFFNSALVHIDPVSGVVTEYPLPTPSYQEPTPSGLMPGSGPFDLEVGQDGRLYIAEFFDKEIVEFDPITKQVIAQYSLPAANPDFLIDYEQLHSISFDEEGNLWFSVNNGTYNLDQQGLGWIGRLTPGKVIQFFPPLSNFFTGGATGMHVDAVNDTLWFGDFFGKRLVKLKKVTEFSGVPPTANAGPDLQVFAGDSVVFSGASSTDPDGTIESYSWSFGDGTPDGSGVTINHMYAIPGLYTAVLTVTDNDGLINSDSLQVTIKRKPGGK